MSTTSPLRPTGRPVQYEVPKAPVRDDDALAASRVVLPRGVGLNLAETPECAVHPEGIVGKSGARGRRVADVVRLYAQYSANAAEVAERDLHRLSRRKADQLDVQRGKPAKAPDAS